jgi:aspartate carbamoyltransferase catalytic subunit
VLNAAKLIKSGTKQVHLNRSPVVHIFFEPSTRTRLSFEMAAHQCHALPIMLDVNTSSLNKGESLVDMMRNIEALGAKALVIRHSNGGIPYFISTQVQIPVINAGDGYHEHPSQGLLDVFTLQEKLGDLKNKHVLILGDIMHSRVAKSNMWGLMALGAKVSVCGPPNLIPSAVQHWGVTVYENLNDALPIVDAVNVLRIQFERQHGISLPTIPCYREQYGLTLERQKLMQEHAIILHPGPINRGVELDSDVADGCKNVILDQVTNGVFVRMAILNMVIQEAT